MVKPINELARAGEMVLPVQIRHRLNLLSLFHPGAECKFIMRPLHMVSSLTRLNTMPVFVCVCTRNADYRQSSQAAPLRNIDAYQPEGPGRSVAFSLIRKASRRVKVAIRK